MFVIVYVVEIIRIPVNKCDRIAVIVWDSSDC